MQIALLGRALNAAIVDFFFFFFPFLDPKTDSQFGHTKPVTISINTPTKPVTQTQFQNSFSNTNKVSSLLLKLVTISNI